jgi:2-phosphosulfolactate phosphatase
MRELSVALHPTLLRSGDLHGRAAAVIDLFRATTTLCTALAAGAVAVRPFRDLAAARAAKARLPDTLLGGERGGVRPEGFDLGNSPREYRPQTVAGRTVLLTTTNGTAAIEAAAPASPLVIACLANLGAACRRLSASGRPVVIVCAGIDGGPSLEDSAAAGALVDRLMATSDDWSPDESALICRELYRGMRGRLGEVLPEARGGRNLRDIGLAEDLPVCLEVDTLDAAPVLTGRDPLEIRLE